MGISRVIINKAKKAKQTLEGIKDGDELIQEQSAVNARRWEEFSERVQEALTVMANQGYSKEANGRIFVELDLKNTDIPTPTKGYMITTEQLIRNRDGGSKSTFASTKRVKGHRQEMVSISCELLEFIKLCKESGVKVPKNLLEKVPVNGQNPERFISTATSEGLVR